MSDEPGPGAEAPAGLTHSDFDVEFRVVSRKGGARRGMRLERFYWSALKRMAAANGMTIGAQLEEIVAAQPADANVSSSVRVACGRWLDAEVTRHAVIGSMETLNAILAATPSPAFVLSSAKKILSFNDSFQSFVRRQLPVGEANAKREDLKLAIDANITDIFRDLDAARSKPATTGFVIGTDDRRYRGQLAVVRAPVAGESLLLAFVIVR